MKTLNSIACAGGIAVAMLSSSLTVAGSVEQEAASRNSNASSQVHRVSHALAEASSYQGTSNAGYKWGKQRVQGQDKSASQWGQSSTLQSGYKWGNSTSSSASKPAYASTSGNRWGVRNYSEQAGNRWGVRNYSEQAGNRWGVRNYSEQAGNRWGVR